MKPNELKQFLKVVLQKDPTKVILLQGPVGIGKTEITEQVAKELGWELREVILSLMDPTDLKGIPFADMDAKIARWLRAEYLPPEDYDKPLLLFFDELNNSPSTLQNAVMNMLLRRNLNGYKIPSQTRMIGAGNILSDDCYTYRLSPALRTRLINIDVEISFEDWKQWAYRNNINPLVIGFHNYRNGELLYNYKSGMNIDKPFACPRTWKYVSDFMNMKGLSDEIMYDTIRGTIGEGAATEFHGYCKVYGSLPDPEDILLKGKNIVPKESNVMYALISALINCVKGHKEKLNRLIEYSMKIQPEFSVVLVKDLLKTEMKDEAMGTDAFDEWLKENADIIAK